MVGRRAHPARAKQHEEGDPDRPHGRAGWHVRVTGRLIVGAAEVERDLVTVDHGIANDLVLGKRVDAVGDHGALAVIVPVWPGGDLVPYQAFGAGDHVVHVGGEGTEAVFRDDLGDPAASQPTGPN